MKFTKLWLAGAALLVTTGMAVAAPAVVTNDLNVRTGPGTGFQVKTVLPAGTTVDVRSCSGSWCRIALAGMTGYASRNYLGQGARRIVVPAPVYEEPYYESYPVYGPGFGAFYGGPRVYRGRTYYGGGHYRGAPRVAPGGGGGLRFGSGAGSGPRAGSGGGGGPRAGAGGGGPRGGASGGGGGARGGGGGGGGGPHTGPASPSGGLRF